MSKLGKATIGLMVVTLASKFLGFGRELALTYAYGATYIADAYITSMSIPGVLFASIGAAVSTTFIPLFFETEKIGGRKKSLEFANNILNIILIISFLVAIIGFIFAEPLVKIFAINFEGEKLILAVTFTRIMIFGVIFIGLSNIMTAWLQINGEFVIPGMTTFPYNLIIIIGILLSMKVNLNIMAIGTLLGIISQFIFQIPFAVKKGYKYNKYINLKDKYVKKMMMLILPVFIGVAVNQVNVIVDRSLASTLGDGYITILNSASRLNTFVIGIFIAAIATVIYPTLSKMHNQGDNESFINSVTQSINISMLLIIPISIGTIVLAKPVVRIVFERGAFDSEATKMTAIALSCYAVGMIGYALREILDKIFYSLQDTKTPMINGGLAMGMNIILNFMFVQKLGYVGLALATSISSILCTILLLFSLKKKIKNFEQNKVIKILLKSIVSAILMGLVALLSYKFLANILGLGFIKEAIALGGAVGIGALVYGILIILFKVEEVNIAIDMVKKKLNRV